MLPYYFTLLAVLIIGGYIAHEHLDLKHFQRQVESVSAKLKGSKVLHPSRWHDLKTDPSDLPVEGTSVLCYVPAWEDYVVAYTVYEDNTIEWRMDGDQLSQANWPSRWQTIVDPAP